MYCFKCGRNIRNDSRFCSYCGVDLRKEDFKNKSLIDLLTKSRGWFFDYVLIYNKKYRPDSDSFKFYKKIIEKHKQLKNYNLLFDDENFFDLLYETLKSWNLNQRAAKLTSPENLRNSILSLKNQITELSQFTLINLSPNNLEKILAKIRIIFNKVEVMNSKRRIVGVSKTLHFSLPDLIMPIDSKYTMEFFYGYNKYEANEPEKEFNTFKEIFRNFYKIAKKLNLSEKDVDNIGWNTSIPKIIDNAIIGYFIENENSLSKSPGKI